MTSRLLQNFKGGRALVVNVRASGETTLETTLAKLGVATEYPALINGRAQIDIARLQADRDILFIDGDLEGAVTIEVDPVSRLLPVPVIGLVGVEAPSRLKALVNLGAIAFLRKPVHGGAVYTSLFMGINQFLIRSDLYDRVRDLEVRRRGRRNVIRAVILLMQQRGCDEEAAYSELRRESMRRQKSLEGHCEEFLNDGQRRPMCPAARVALRYEASTSKPCRRYEMIGATLNRLRTAALTGTFILSTSLAMAADPIKLGVLEDQSGDFAVATIGKVHAIQLAADEINKSGGIMGRPLELVVYDTQSDNTRYQEFMRRVLQRDKVDAVFAGFSSASREAYRPIVDQLNGLAFYNNQYEGGVCDGHMIVTGAVPEQQFSTLIPYMMQTYGKKVYTLAADYNFGQISAEWVRNIVKENGGTMAGEEFIPLGVSQFSQSIQNIQKAKPDFVVTLLVGTAQASYYEQAASANVNLPMASSVNVGQGYEHKRFKPPSLKDMFVTTNWIEEIDNPQSKAFTEKFKTMFPKEPYINQEAENSYLAVYLYKQMVERAKSTKRDDIRKVIAQGDVCMDAPEGKVCIDPKSQHMSHTIYLGKVGADHSITFPKIWPDIKPYWLGDAGCDLTKKDPMAQYTPSNPPPKP